MQDLVGADLWDQLPADLPNADLYLQDELQLAFHPPLPQAKHTHLYSSALNTCGMTGRNP
jgi:hypothetical protein